ncbi:MAG: threonylcarbamoyl-AMP synthase [Desulfomicrobium sp.]|nr:threonylcarbamoyl-AMP synthase [Pseudomonadota bacterium]MBU4595010.1 threonylcarbamoyl-AMP synthase [Pseudomonadota bacterium]MBV1711240.1 threonylcarbamoyl-AMP synthase [Desulfomicrobium sp.]MBV1720159.1 threonylcarbamoyl-AMP synthase [Desulfomicrobium sp.]MBV1746894.1 threonylcarbamoyl-AMP synthase [Desulfomicrobium sp.]
MDDLNRAGILEFTSGGLVIYPTETFYALGCLATIHPAVERIFAVKGRPTDKPLPLIVADWGMCERFLRMRPEEEELARKFWPGSLSIVVDVDPRVSTLARDLDGRSAVRMTPHVIAAELCRAAGAPLVSSSANRSGQPPVCVPGDLDPELVRQSGALVVDAQPWPAGGQPSTMVRVVARNAVRMVRVGAVSAEDISAAGFEVVSEYKIF